MINEDGEGGSSNSFYGKSSQVKKRSPSGRKSSSFERCQLLMVQFVIFNTLLKILMNVIVFKLIRSSDVSFTGRVLTLIPSPPTSSGQATRSE